MTDTRTTKRKRTKWLSIGVIALFILLVLAALLAPKPTDPTIERFEQLALSHGLKPHDNREGMRQFVSSKHSLPEQKALIQDFGVMVAMTGLTTIYDADHNSVFLTAKNHKDKEVKYSVIAQRWRSCGTLLFSLKCTGQRTEVTIEQHKQGVADRVMAGFRRLTGQP